MINLKDPKSQLPSLLAIVGIVVLSLNLAYLFFAPKFDKTKLIRQRNSQTFTLTKRYNEAKDDLESSRTRVANNFWKEIPEKITPIALARLTAMMSNQKVNMVGFRPQKPIETTSLVQVPFNLSVDGRFSDVVALVDKIEKSDSKLAISQFTMASSEGETDLVTASIGLVAFTSKPKSIP